MWKRLITDDRNCLGPEEGCGGVQDPEAFVENKPCMYVHTAIYILMNPFVLSSFKAVSRAGSFVISTMLCHSSCKNEPR